MTGSHCCFLFWSSFPWKDSLYDCSFSSAERALGMGTQSRGPSPLLSEIIVEIYAITAAGNPPRIDSTIANWSNSNGNATPTRLKRALIALIVESASAAVEPREILVSALIKYGQTEQSRRPSSWLRRLSCTIHRSSLLVLTVLSLSVKPRDVRDRGVFCGISFLRRADRIAGTISGWRVE